MNDVLWFNTIVGSTQVEGTLEKVEYDFTATKSISLKVSKEIMIKSTTDTRSLLLSHYLAQRTFDSLLGFLNGATVKVMLVKN